MRIFHCLSVLLTYMPCVYKKRNGAAAGPCPSLVRLLSSCRLPFAGQIRPRGLCLRGLVAGLPMVTSLEGVTKLVCKQLHWLLGNSGDHSGASSGGLLIASVYLEAAVTSSTP